MSIDPDSASSTSSSSADTGIATPSGDIVAGPGTYYRNTRYIMFVLLVAMGGWFLYDGFVKYPAENKIVEQLKAEQEIAVRDGNQAEQMRTQTELKKHEYHNDSGLLLQRLLGFSLPPLGVFALWWALRRSRGEYRLSGTKLSVPGHPTIDLSEIKSVNNDLWDRKGIVWLTYETPAGQQGEIVLDDFIYDRPPTDQIYERIAERFGLTDDDDDEEGEGDADNDVDSTEDAPQ